MVTSSCSIGKDLDSLEKLRLTSANPKAAFLSVPLKITSSMDEPRNSLTLCSPNTQRIASKILLFPQPFGPTIAVMPGSKLRTVRSANDLKQNNSSLLKYINSPLASGVREEIYFFLSKI